MNPLKTWADLEAIDYARCRVVSYHGGATWLHNADKDKFYVVAMMTPIDILGYFAAGPDVTLRVEVL